MLKRNLAADQETHTDTGMLCVGSGEPGMAILVDLAHCGFSECCSSPVQNLGLQGDPLAHSMVIS